MDRWIHFLPTPTLFNLLMISNGRPMSVRFLCLYTGSSCLCADDMYLGCHRDHVQGLAILGGCIWEVAWIWSDEHVCISLYVGEWVCHVNRNEICSDHAGSTTYRRETIRYSWETNLTWKKETVDNHRGIIYIYINNVLKYLYKLSANWWHQSDVVEGSKNSMVPVLLALLLAKPVHLGVGL